MFVPFSELPLRSKIWIYQADRKISADKKNILTDTLRSFTEEWLVHGQTLEASFDVRFDQFVILAANDSASGCSIDNSVRIMKDLGKALEIDFLNRNLIAFKNGEEVTLIPLPRLKESYKMGIWTKQTLVFNNAVSTLEELKNGWLVPAEKTWLKRYFSQESIAN